MLSKALAAELADLRARVSGGNSPGDLGAFVAAMRRTVPLAEGTDASAAAEAAARGLPRAWRPQRFHADQAAAWASRARFRAIEAGRRSGKSEGRKREIVIAALDPSWALDDRFVVVGAPTQAQAMRLYWRHLIRMIPPGLLAEERKTDCELALTNGAVIRVVGMDKPQRAEGDPIDFLFLDEFADMRLGRAVLDDHLAPSLDTPDRPAGQVTVYGTPDLRSGAHFVDLCDQWRERAESGSPSFGYFHWSSRGIVSAEAWEEARSTMDPASFAVEYEARRVSTGNRAYYTFDRDRHVVRGLRLVPTRAAVVACDWNYDPGTATILQEQTAQDYPAGALPAGVSSFTAVVAEVFIRRSNTPQVMRRVLSLLEERGHRGPVIACGDPAGGAPGSAKVEGSDIDLLRSILGAKLGDRLALRFVSYAPAVVARLNAVNRRLLVDTGEVRLLIDSGCKETIRDFEQVRLKDGSAGEIDKSPKGDNAMRTHLTDGLGYYIADKFPVRDRGAMEVVDA